MQGGMITIRERPSLEFGFKSLVQNLRCWHPSYETRKGYTKLNTTAYNASSDSPLNIYQFVKGKVSENHFFVQFGNGNLQESTNAPPTTQTTFGSTVFAGSSGQIPASFTNISDIMIYSNGADQHQIYAGQTQKISAFVVVKDTGTHDLFPDLGEDYTDELTDNDSTTVAVLDSLGDLSSDYDAIYIMTKTPIDLFNVTVSAANGTASTLAFAYWNSSSGWANTSITDNTADGGATLAQSGTIVSSLAADERALEVPRYMFGQSGFWYRLSLSAGDLDSETEISALTYDAETFTSMVNVWNGVPTDLIEAHFYDDDEAQYDLYAAETITLSDMTSSDALYVSSAYPLEGAYHNFGATPNTDGTPTISWQYWDGSAWQDLTETDGTGNWTESGWMWWGRQTDEQKRQFRNTQYYAYWYKITVSTTLSDNVVLSLTGMPYFDINELGRIGNVSAAWKVRALYTFDKFPRDIYVSQSGDPLYLNGSDYAILQPGDGRDNATKAIAEFHNEIMVWQEERGKRGGCVTIFEGYSPATFGKLVLSTQIGTFSAKTVAVVDGSKSSSTKRDLNSQTQAFFLSHYGVFMSDGRIVTCISDDIQNYFDERFSECIRKGYEDEMWLEWDSTENLIKVGIVSGSSATTCNKFFCYDLTDGVWYEDVYADSISVFREVEAGSGQYFTVQVAAGSTTGYVYHMNNGTNDDGDAIDATIKFEFSHGPYFINIEEILTRVKVQGAGTSYSWIIEENDVSVDTGTGSMVAAVTNETIRRNRHLLKAGSIPWISFTITANTLDVPIYLYDIAVMSTVTENK